MGRVLKIALEDTVDFVKVFDDGDHIKGMVVGEEDNPRKPLNGSIEFVEQLWWRMRGFERLGEFFFCFFACVRAPFNINTYLIVFRDRVDGRQ